MQNQKESFSELNIKKDFQIFENYKKENKKEMVFLDSAASSLTPDCVISKMNEYYFKYRSNIDRGLYKSAERATYEYEKAREKVAKFLNVTNEEIIFTGGSTISSNNLIIMFENYYKQKIEKFNLIDKNKIIVSNFSHHSDLLPIQEFVKRNNLELVYINNDQDAIKNIDQKTLLVSIPIVSNVTGKIFDIESISKKVKQFNAFIFCDMTAAIGHIKLDINKLNIDGAYFAAHKMCGPTGVGVLYIKRELSRQMYPSFFGGGMVWEVSANDSNYRSDIKRFEGGTANIAGVIGLGAAVDYIDRMGIENIENYIKDLTSYAIQKMENLNSVNKYENKNDLYNIKNGLKSDIQFIKLYTEKNLSRNAGIISFNIKDIHSHDVAQILADNHIAVRAGHHCAQPLMKSLCVPALTRVSFYLYNDKKDIDFLIDGLKKVKEVFNK